MEYDKEYQQVVEDLKGKKVDAIYEKGNSVLIAYKPESDGSKFLLTNTLEPYNFQDIEVDINPYNGQVSLYQFDGLYETDGEVNFIPNQFFLIKEFQKAVNSEDTKKIENVSLDTIIKVNNLESKNWLNRDKIDFDSKNLTITFPYDKSTSYEIGVYLTRNNTEEIHSSALKLVEQLNNDTRLSILDKAQIIDDYHLKYNINTESQVDMVKTEMEIMGTEKKLENNGLAIEEKEHFSIRDNEKKTETITMENSGTESSLCSDKGKNVDFFVTYENLIKSKIDEVWKDKNTQLVSLISLKNDGSSPNRFLYNKEGELTLFQEGQRADKYFGEISFQNFKDTLIDDIEKSVRLSSLRAMFTENSKLKNLDKEYDCIVPDGLLEQIAINSNDYYHVSKWDQEEANALYEEEKAKGRFYNDEETQLYAKDTPEKSVKELPIEEMKHYGIIDKENKPNAVLKAEDYQNFLNGSILTAHKGRDVMTYQLSEDKTQLNVQAFQLDKDIKSILTNAQKEVQYVREENLDVQKENPLNYGIKVFIAQKEEGDQVVKEYNLQKDIQKVTEFILEKKDEQESNRYFVELEKLKGFLQHKAEQYPELAKDINQDINIVNKEMDTVNSITQELNKDVGRTHIETDVNDYERYEQANDERQQTAQQQQVQEEERSRGGFRR